MQKVPVHYSDLQLLHNFFASGSNTFSIYDPGQRLLYNNRSPVFTENGLFNLSPNGSEIGTETKFYFGDGAWNRGRRFIYVNNPDGTIRWMMPAETNTASHLALYNSSTVKGGL